MTTTTHAQGEFEILVQGTGSGRGPSIIVRPDEPADEYEYRELAHLETYELSRNARYTKSPEGNRWEYDWYPNPCVHHDEVAANARLFCESARLLAACRKLLADAETCPGAYIYSRPLIRAIQAVVEQIDTPVEFAVEEL